jgi:hypothetical protein
MRLTIQIVRLIPLLVAMDCRVGAQEGPHLTIPEMTTILPGQQAPLGLGLTGPAPAGGVFVTLTSSDISKVTVSPATILILEGATTPARPVYLTGIAGGAAVINASAFTLPTVSESVTVAGQSTIVLSPGQSISSNQPIPLSLTLSTPAPTGGLTVTLSNNDPAVLSISSASVFVGAGSTAPLTAVQLTGLAAGSATLTATAPSYGPATETIHVQGSGSEETLSFSPATLNLTGLVTGNLQLTLSAPAPAGGLTINLSSGNNGVATIPASMEVSPGATSVSVPVTAVGAGSVPITADALGWTGASAAVTVTLARDIILPSGVTVTPGQTINFPVTLANPAPAGGVFVSISSSDASKVTVSSAAVLISQGATTSRWPLQITGIASGTASISASAFNLTGDTVVVQVGSGAAAPMMSFSPSSLTVAGNGVTQNVTLALPALAPAGGLTASLSSSNPSVATVPPTATFAAGTGAANIPVTSVAAGSAIIHAMAPPTYSDVTANVTVVSSPQIILPGNISLAPGQSVSFPIVLANPAPVAGVTVTLTSSAPSVISISPGTVFIAAGAFMPAVQPQVTGVTAGSAVIAASAPGFATASQPLNVQVTNTSVTWYGACWEPATIYGVTGNFQAIDFAMTTTNPVTVQGTLFFAPNCDPSQGTDNMNDYGTLTGSTHTIQGFSHHPNVIPSSAVYWMGPLTANGMCAPGSPCSGCVNYTNATPVCSSLP